MRAYLAGKIDLFDAMLTYGANINSSRKTDGKTVLFFAIENNDINFLEKYNESIDLNHITVNGMSPLLAAASVNAVEIAHFLIKKGVDLSSTDSHGNNALIIASKYGHYEMVHFLMRNGFDVNKLNHNGDNALYFAKLVNDQRYERIAHLLVLSGSKEIIRPNQLATGIKRSEQSVLNKNWICSSCGVPFDTYGYCKCSN